MADAGGDLQLHLEALRQRYSTEVPVRVEHLRSLWGAIRANPANDADFRKFHRITHNLAGSGATFGFSALSNSAITLDTFLQPILESHTAPTNDQCDHIESLLEQIEQAMGQRDDHSILTHRPVKPVTGDDGGTLIFLLDDDAEQAQSMAIEIAHFEYSVKTFDGLFALDDAVKEQRPAAIVMDMIFREGRLAGAETVAQLQRQTGGEIPVVFTSVRTDFEARLNAVRAGADAYFAKPVEISELVDQLDLLTGRTSPEPYRVLVIEDDAAMAEYYRSVLEQAGMTTDVLTDPMKVMERIVEFAPDLIMTDLYMPGCTGFDLARVIRQQNAYAALPMVFLSSERREDRQLSAISLGGDAFLTKPVGAEQLVASITSRTERSRTLRSLMMRDGLTGLLNHSHIKEHLAIEVDRAQRTGAYLAFAMLDIDHFKSVNDTYGHPTGDRVLKNLAQVLTRRLRKTDVVGRYGGEEFAIILTNTTGERAHAIIDDIRARFSRVRHRHEDGVFTVTFSGGVAEFPRFTTDESLSNTADEALYEAKNGGRDRIVLAGASKTPANGA
jgi:diguanylate cyclase (GGDEF)-like protein